MEFSGERFFEEPPVEQMGQGIANRLLAEGFAKLLARQRECDLGRCSDGKRLVGIAKGFPAGGVRKV